MIILTIRTDKPEAEVGIYDDTKEMAYISWEAHRQLAESLHQKIKQLLLDSSLEWWGLQGIAVYEGPGSFTGLRIGISVANALAYSLGIAVAGGTADNWRTDAISKLQGNQGAQVVLPQYGSPVHITAPKR
jgi:tRNA threonylcarbamoyladenosine biosynthesis protein TsaB